MVVDIAFANVLVYVLVFVRFAGMLGFNPIFSRNNVPPMVRLGLCVFLALMITPLQPAHVFANIYGMGAVVYAFAALWELGVGVILGFVFQLFYMFLFYAGDLVDTDIGLAMAKTFDPATNINTGFTASFFTLLFTLYLFTTGSHLTLIYLFTDTFKALEVGGFQFSVSIVGFILRLFTRAIVLAMRLWAPFMAAEFVLQISMGILMKFIPQITVFVINFQLKIALGLIMLYVFSPYVGQFITGYIEVMFDNLVEAVAVMGSG